MTRCGLVLGAGGVQGMAWSSGTLVALEQATGWDPRTADVLVGTSQGALMSSLIASGIGTKDLLGWYRRELPATHPLRHKVSNPEPPPRTLPVPASPGLTLRALRRPGQVPPIAALSGLLPAGQQSLDAFLAPLAALIEPPGWVDHDATWVVAVDYETGQRVPFGAPEAPQAGIHDAVRASCSVPGAYHPTRIDGRTYVDGAVWSSTSLDLLAPLDLERIIVLAPMVQPGRVLPRSMAKAINAAAQRLARQRLEAEVETVRSTGTTVHVLTPSAEDVAVMGQNMLSRRGRFDTFETALRNADAKLAGAGLSD